jgi:hypothetical protein
MKYSLTLLLFLCLSASISAQQSVKKYILIEHFTNSKCPICGFKNPAFYDLIAQYPHDIHPIAIHPPIPYNSCVFYVANKDENDYRSIYYGIQGTPQVALNGDLYAPATPILAASDLQPLLTETSPLNIQVTETGTTNRTVTINAHAFGAIPSATYTLNVFVAEKVINYNAPNGETVHHDVFRKMLPDKYGTVFNAPAQGQTASFTFDYTVDPSWAADQVYVVAFVQNKQTKEVLNSGTRFDPVVTAVSEPGASQTVEIFPNPAQETARIRLVHDRATAVELFDLNGKRIQSGFNPDGEQLEIRTGNCPPGLYLVKIQGENGVYTAKLVKE